MMQIWDKSVIMGMKRGKYSMLQTQGKIYNVADLTGGMSARAEVCNTILVFHFYTRA